MEMIRVIVKQFYPLLILFSCLSFVVYIFFSAELNNGEGVFEGAGSVYVNMIGTDELKNEGLNHVQSNEDGYVPMLKYNSGVRNVGDCVNFKEMFLAQKEDGSFVEAKTEDGFALYLEDIRNQSGNSVLVRLSSEEIERLEEIPASFIYDNEQGLLYFYGSGTYVVYVKVYGNGGAVELYEFNLPVETR